MPVVIKMKGLPFEATSRDIQMFFIGMELNEQDIHLAAYKDGKASGIGFAIFRNDDDARKAMYRTGKYIGKRYIELFLSSVAEMESLLYNGVPEPRGRAKEPMPMDAGPGLLNRADFLVRQERGHSMLSRPENIGMQENQRGVVVDSVRGAFGNGLDGGFGRNQMVMGIAPMAGSVGQQQRYGVGGKGLPSLMSLDNKEERPRGRSPVGRDRNPPQRDRGPARKGSSPHRRERSPHRRVRSPLQRESRPPQRDRSPLRRDMSPPRRERSPPSRDRSMGSNKGRSSGSDGRYAQEQKEYGSRGERPTEKQQSRGDLDDLDREKSTCVRLFGLPWEATNDDIFKFFQGLRVVSIEMLTHYSGKNRGKSTGVAFAVFRTIREASDAMKMDQKYMGNRYLELRRVSKNEMVMEIEMHEQGSTGQTSSSRGSHDEGYSRSESRHASGSQYEDSRRSSGTRERGRGERRGDRYEKEDRRRDERGQASHRFRPEESSSLAGQGFLAGDLAQDVQDMQYQLANAVAPNTGMNVNQALETLSALAMTANINTEDITSGCVIGVRNLPSSITAEEIMDFFYGFRVLPDSIRIHYLSPGRSSGDAMITFANNAEAYAAIEQLNFKPVGKKKVQLFLV